MSAEMERDALRVALVLGLDRLTAGAPIGDPPTAGPDGGTLDLSTAGVEAVTRIAADRGVSIEHVTRRAVSLGLDDYAAWPLSARPRSEAMRVVRGASHYTRAEAGEGES